MADDKLGIKLEIGDEQVSVNIEREMEPVYRAAGRLINQRINMYRTVYPQKENEQILSMALIDIALSYELSANSHDADPYLQSMEQLTKEIEETLK